MIRNCEMATHPQHVVLCRVNVDMTCRENRKSLFTKHYPCIWRNLKGLWKALWGIGLGLGCLGWEITHSTLLSVLLRHAWKVLCLQRWSGKRHAAQFSSFVPPWWTVVGHFSTASVQLLEVAFSILRGLVCVFNSSQKDWVESSLCVLNWGSPAVVAGLCSLAYFMLFLLHFPKSLQWRWWIKCYLTNVQKTQITVNIFQVKICFGFSHF